jgi:hypothetical protein
MLLTGVVAGLLVLFGGGLLMTRERRSEVTSQPAPPTGAYHIVAGAANSQWMGSHG